MSEKRKINILQVVNGFAVGGAELKLLELVKTFQERYPDTYNQYVCGVGQGGALHERFTELGIKTFVFSKKNKFDISQVFKVASLMKAKSIDIIQSTLFYADIIGAMAAKLAKVPVHISWETVSHKQNYMHSKWRQQFAYNWAMKSAYRIVGVSQEVKDSIIEKRKIDAAKIDVIYYGVDLRKFTSEKNTAIKKELRLSDDKKIIGVVGRLDPVKGHTYLLDALAHVIKKLPNLHCLIIGDGPSRSDLEQQALRLGIAPHISFLGFRNDVKDLLSAFNLFVLPSKSEGLPNAILEAMASGVAVVATSVGGIPEVIKDGETGLLVQPTNVDQLGNAVYKILSDDTLHASIVTKAHKLVTDRFSLDGQIEGFHQLYQRSISGKSGKVRDFINREKM
ncbi:glycosyltransferase [candidate division KSB1 bacterium]|nr:glycosyltransferase [candidate division KSB1 bacterium]